MPQGGIKNTGANKSKKNNTAPKGGVSKKGKIDRGKNKVTSKDVAKKKLTKVINKNIERELIAKCEGSVQGSLRIVEADRTPTHRKERKELQKKVLELQRKQPKVNKH